jgi:hypothetical protein
LDEAAARLAKWQNQSCQMAKEDRHGGALPRRKRMENRQDARGAKRLAIKGGEFQKKTLAALAPWRFSHDRPPTVMNAEGGQTPEGRL